MDLGIVGIIDIIIILSVFIFVMIGVKKGFMKNATQFLSKICGLLFAVAFSPSVGSFINNHIFNEGKVHNNIYNFVDGKVSGVLANEESLDATIDSLGLPGFIDNYIKSGIQNYDVSTITNDITSRITYVFAVIIAFFILLFGITIIAFIIKRVADVLRTNKVIRVVDGFLGGIFLFLVSLFIIYFLLLIITEVSKINAFSSFRDFLNIDMQLNTTEFRLSKYMNDHNVIRTIYGIIFGK